MNDEVVPVPPMSNQQIEWLAVAFVEEFYPGQSTELRPFPAADWFEFDLPERTGVKCLVANLPEGVEGVTHPSTGILISPQTYQGLQSFVGRARFTVAHEGAHGLLHLRHQRRVHCQARRGEEFAMYRRSEIKPYLDPEWQARRLAAAILAPRTALSLFVERYGWDAPRLAQLMQMSAEAARLRLADAQRLGLV